MWCFVDEGVKQVRITSFSGSANFFKHLKIIIIIITIFINGWSFHEALFISAFIPNLLDKNLTSKSCIIE